MAVPPPLANSAPAESSTDRALALALSGDLEPALRLSAALLARDPSAPTALLLTGRLLGELGRDRAARDACARASAHAIARANLPLAVAAAREGARFGGDLPRGLEAIAAAFCKGSPRLDAGHTPAPPIPALGVSPLAETRCGAALLDEASAIVDRALATAPDARARIARQPLISSIGQGGLLELCAATSAIWLPAGARVIDEGSPGGEAYLVARGELEVTRAGKSGPIALAKLGAGALFGEMALLARAPRAASVAASRPSIVIEVKRVALDGLADRQPEIGATLAAYCRERMLGNLERTSPVLSVVPPVDRGALMDRFCTRVFEPEEHLIAMDEPPRGLYLIASGEVLVVRPDTADGEPLVVARLGPGDVAGEVALVLRRRASADVIAVHPTVTLFLPASDFMGLIHDHPAMLAELYLLAVRRDEETSSIVQEEAAIADDFVLV